MLYFACGIGVAVGIVMELSGFSLPQTLLTGTAIGIVFGVGEIIVKNLPNR